MIKIIKFQSRNILLLSALFLGFFAGNFSYFIKDNIIYILTFMMTLSLHTIPNKIFTPHIKLIKPILSSILLNYFLFSIILLLLVYLFIPYDKELMAGFVLIAVSPPGIVIVPFAVRHKTDVDWATIGVIGSYLFLLILFPLTMLFFNADINYSVILNLLFFSVILPIFLSRIMRVLPTYSLISKYQGRLIDISFFILIYVVIGINQEILLTNFSLALTPLIIFIVLLFPITFFFIYINKKLHLSNQDNINRTLMFSVKNNGFSAVTALTLFGTVAAIPSAVLSVVLLIYLILFPTMMNKIVG